MTILSKKKGNCSKNSGAGGGVDVDSGDHGGVMPLALPHPQIQVSFILCVINNTVISSPSLK